MQYKRNFIVMCTNRQLSAAASRRFMRTWSNLHWEIRQTLIYFLLQVIQNIFTVICIFICRIFVRYFESTVWKFLKWKKPIKEGIENYRALKVLEYLCSSWICFPWNLYKPCICIWHHPRGMLVAVANLKQAPHTRHTHKQSAHAPTKIHMRAWIKKTSRTPPTHRPPECTNGAHKRTHQMAWRQCCNLADQGWTHTIKARV